MTKEAAIKITFNHLKLRLNDFNLSANFSINCPSRVALLGPSGGGKSSLLSALAGFITPQSGNILYGINDITYMAPSERPLTLLFQDHNLFPHLTVTQNIGLGLRPNLNLTKEETVEINTLLEDVGLEKQGKKMPAQLSGGQQQRVALARCLIQNKPILCLDEPFAALGPALKRKMLDLVLNVTKTRNITLILVTHQPEDAQYFAEKTIIVAEGKAYAPISTDILFDNPPPILNNYL